MTKRTPPPAESRARRHPHVAAVVVVELLLVVVLSLPATTTAFVPAARSVAPTHFSAPFLHHHLLRAETVAATTAAAAADSSSDAPPRTAASISALTAGVPTVLTSEQIDQILPHRFPFALVDRVVALDTTLKTAVGIKTVTKNEDCFNGHFPGQPVLPGVLQVEALAQLAGIVCLQLDGATPGAVFFFAGVDGVKWKKPVVPGDTLVMQVQITKWNAKFGLAKANGQAYVDGVLALDVQEMTFAMAK